MNEHVPMPLPASAQRCRERQRALQAEIASIRVQIATTDIRRQIEHRGLDPDWFHRAKTALRLKQAELAEVVAELQAANRSGARERFKDALIEVVRARFDDEEWAGLVAAARAWHHDREVRHG